MTESDLLTTVYSWLFPEVEAVVRDWADEYPHELFQENIRPGLDELHLPLFERFTAYHRAEVTGWEAFPHRYPVSGSSEGLFHLLAEHRTATPGLALYALDGEYEGYRAYAESLRVPLVTLPPEALLTAPAGRLFLSHPSARDGNPVDRELLRALLDRHRVVLDLAYLGMTAAPLDLDLDHPNVDAVVTSMSKPFGLYYHRVGFCFARRPIASLYATKWFKNAASITLAERVLDRIPPRSLAERYRPLQLATLDRLSAEGGPRLTPSEVFLLAWTDRDPGADLAGFRRADRWRFCLTERLRRERSDTEEVGHGQRALV